jgi:hypothetical protein
MELLSFLAAGATLAPSLSSGTCAQHSMRVRLCLKRFSGPPKYQA